MWTIQSCKQVKILAVDRNEVTQDAAEIWKVTGTEIGIRWNFSMSGVNSYLRVIPPDIDPVISTTPGNSAELTNLLPGSFYQIQIFPFFGGNFTLSSVLGDPILVSVETKLEKPSVFLLSYSETSACGSASVAGHFGHASINVINHYIEPVRVSGEEEIAWCFYDLYPASKFSLMLTIFTENGQISSETLEFMTRPSKPLLVKHELKNDNSAEISFRLREMIEYFEYGIFCYDVEIFHESSAYENEATFTTEPRFHGCTLEAWSILHSVRSFGCVLVVGLSILESVYIDKLDADTNDLYYTHKGPALTRVLIQYEVLSSRECEFTFLQFLNLSVLHLGVPSIKNIFRHRKVLALIFSSA